MNEDTFSEHDPFSPTALDETTELRALSQALRMSQGFKLIFARCNHPGQRQRLVEKLIIELRSLKIQEIQFTEPLTHLLDALRQRIEEPAPNAIFVSGLEYSLPSAVHAHATPFVANLNASRNSFPDSVDCALVLWVPEYVLNAIMMGAPDFFSIRSGVYFFAAGPSETADLVQNLMGGDVATLDSLEREEKIERVKAIESLLADYYSLPENERNPEAEMRLGVRLGNLQAMLGSYDEALAHYQEALDQAKRSRSLSFESAANGGLGIVYSDLGKFSEAKVAFERALELSLEIRDRFGEAMDLRNLGNVSAELGEWEKAGEFYNKSLELIRGFGDRLQEARTLINLSNILRHQGRLSEAEKLSTQALKIAHELSDKYTEGTALQSLGIVYQQEGRTQESNESYRRALQIAHELGDYEGEWKILHNQSLLCEEQGDIAGAISVEKRAVKILNDIKAKELPSEQSRLAYLGRKAKDQDETRKQPA